MTTTDRLRSDIDSGRTGDKVATSDPAAAPLGTDDEAAGTPPSRQRIEMTRQREIVRAEPQFEERHIGGAVVYISIIAAIIALMAGFTLILAGR